MNISHDYYRPMHISWKHGMQFFLERKVRDRTHWVGVAGIAFLKII